MTIFKSFHKGDFPAGSYPQPSIGGSPLSRYQVNAVKHWRDGTQTCTINSVTSDAEPTVSLSCPGSVVKEGELLTIAGNASIPNGTYAIVGITSTNPLVGYLPAATSSGISTTGSVTAPDYGSIMEGYITFSYSSASVTYDGSGNVTGGLTQIDFVPNSSPCYLGNQATCDAAALTQSGMLAFNSSSWGMEIDTAVNQGTATGSANARTMMTAGAWKYLIKGPLLTQVIVEDLTPGAPVYDWGFMDLDTTVLTANINATQTIISVADCTEGNNLGLPTNISVEPIHGTGLPEIMTVTACSAGSATVTRGVSGSTAQAANRASSIIWVSAPAGSPSSWTERPLAVGNTSNNRCASLSAAGTSIQIGGYDFFAQIAGSAPYTIQSDSEQMTVSSISSPSSGYGTLNFSARGTNGTTAAVHGGCAWYYAQPWPSNWVNAPSNSYKSLHPMFILSFYTPDGVHQWPGVDEQAILQNEWLHKANDQFYTLTIKTGASGTTLKVNGDRVPHPWGTEWRRRFWDGTAPGGVDCAYGTQTGCAVAIDYNFAYLVYTGLIPPYDTTTYPISTTEASTVLTNWCNTNPVSNGGFCPSATPQQSWNYTEPGEFVLYQPNTGGRGENSHVTRWCADYLYMLDVTTQTHIQWNLEGHEICDGNDNGTTHWSMNVRDDSTGLFFDDLGTVPSFGLPISRDAHPTTTGNVNTNWFSACTAADCPALMGITENIVTSTSGGRIGDQQTLDLAHSGTFPWISYLTSGDYYYLDSLYQWASMFIRASNIGTTQSASHNSWAIMNSIQTRAYAWGWRDLNEAAGLAPDSPSEMPAVRYFQQKLAYNTEAREGWMVINNGYFADSKSTSPYYWGLNTVHAVASNSAVTNPLGLWNPVLGVSALINLQTPSAAPCTTGTYPICTSTQEAGWQNGFGIISVTLSYEYGFTFVQYVRQAMAQGEIAFVNNASPSYVIATEYVATRTSSNNGVTPLQGTGSIAYNPNDATQAAISSWSTINATVCSDSTSGCSGNSVSAALGRWNVGPNEDEAYPSIQWAALASAADVDLSPCPLRTSGTSPCGLVARQWMVANMPNQSTFATVKTWGFAPVSAASGECQIVIASCPSATTGTSYACSIATAGCAAPSWSIASGALPAWASLNGGSGAITGTPTGSTPSTSSFTVKVTDANGNPTLATSILDCTPPTITTSSPLPNGSAGSAYGLSFGATGDASITWSATGLPAFLSLSTGGILSGAPTGNGAFAFNVTATNGCGSQGPLAFSLQVNSGVSALSNSVSLKGSATVH